MTQFRNKSAIRKHFEDLLGRIKRRRVYSIIILIVIFASLVLVLRGSVPEKNATQIDGTSYLESIDSSSFGPQIWSDNLTGQPAWQLYPDNGTQGILTFKNGSLNLTAFFPGSSQYLAVSIYRRPINVSLTYNPIVIATVEASKGIHYGMRLSGVEPGNVPFQAWYESSPLQHRPGQGTDENLTANLALDSYVANGQFPPPNSDITSIKFDIEATPGQTGWFSLILSHIAILSTQQKPYAEGSPSNGLIIHLNNSFTNAQPSNQSLFQVYVGYRIGGTSDLQYKLYLSEGLHTLAEGFEYHLKPIVNYEIAVLYPWNVYDFPLVYSDSNDSYISVVALQGSINYFKLDTLLFDYLSQTLTQSATVDQNVAQFLISYYMIFLFVTPISMALLFARSFRDEQETPSNS